MSTVLSFRSTENKHIVYRGKDVMIKFCEFLRGYTMKIINFKKEKIKLLTKEQQESSESRQIIYSLYLAKEIAKKVYNNIINSIKL